MTTRRDFIRTGGLTVAALAIAGKGKLLAYHYWKTTGEPLFLMPTGKK
mgnify:CR=1 FL=1